MDKVRVGIIGVGWWGTVGHLEPLSKDPKAEIVAVWSRTPDKARQRAEQYGVPRYYTDHRRMIDECGLDAVIVASTPNMHYEQARYALEHGLHVLVEKPFVLEAEHANALERIARERDLLLTVCHPELYPPALAKAKEAMEAGKLGKVLMISAIHSQRVYDLYQGNVPDMFDRRPGDSPRPNAGSYSDPAIAGGGEGHTQVSHILGAILWLTRLAPEKVFARMNNLGLAVDVVDAMTIRFANGALATVAANGLLPSGAGARFLQIQGDRGIVSVDSLSSAVYLVVDDGARGLCKTTIPLLPGGYLSAQVPKNFCRAVLGEEPLYVGMDVAINESRILAAAYRSAACGCEVDVER